MACLGSELESESSDEEWVFSSTKTQPKATTTVKKTPQKKLTISAASIRTIRANIPKSNRLAPLQPQLPLPILKSVVTAPIVLKKPIEIPSLQFISDTELHAICLEMNADLLVTRLVNVYKSSEIFIRIREIEKEALSIEMRLKDQLCYSRDPCGFILVSFFVYTFILIKLIFFVYLECFKSSRCLFFRTTKEQRFDE